MAILVTTVFLMFARHIMETFIFIVYNPLRCNLKHSVIWSNNLHSVKKLLCQEFFWTSLISPNVSSSHSDVLCVAAAGGCVQLHADQHLDVETFPFPLFLTPPLSLSPHLAPLSLFLRLSSNFFTRESAPSALESVFLFLWIASFLPDCVLVPSVRGWHVEANEAQCPLLFVAEKGVWTLSQCEPDMLTEAAAATVFTEGELPYQCVCCHLLHCFSGKRVSVSPELLFTKSRQASDFYPHVTPPPDLLTVF